MTDNQKKIQTMKLQEEINKLQEQLTLVTSQMETQQKDCTAKQVRGDKRDSFLIEWFVIWNKYVILYFLQEKELIQRQEEFKRQLDIWKEEEKMRMNSKIDEVKQTCQRDMDSMHQKNRNLENVCFYFIYSTLSYLILSYKIIIFIILHNMLDFLNFEDSNL